MKKRPKVGVSAIIINNNKVLLGKRKNAHGQGSWSFPGGHLEFNETLEDCIKREVLEEVGIIVKNIKFAIVTNDFFNKEDKHYITIFMVCDYASGEVKNMEPHKCEGWQWFEWNKLPRPLFLPIENLLKQKYNPFRFA